MKRQIRRGVFETNSSSMHSLTVMKRDAKYTPEEILKDIHLRDDKDTGEKNCVWNIWYDTDLDFGRSPFRALATFKEKWLYACASLVHEYNDDVYKELVEIALKYVPNLKKIKLPTTERSFVKVDDCEDNKYHDDYYKTEEELIEYLEQKGTEWDMEIEYYEHCGCWYYNALYTGYVDDNILSGFLESEGITVEEFITNKKYVVIQDGDEYCYWIDMKKAGLINMDAIDHEYPKEDC